MQEALELGRNNEAMRVAKADVKWLRSRSIIVLIEQYTKAVMLSTLCRQLSSTCTLRPMSTSPELVSVLKLNMLQDNPGAVKKVSGLLFFFFSFWSNQ